MATQGKLDDGTISQKYIALPFLIFFSESIEVFEPLVCRIVTAMDQV